MRFTEVLVWIYELRGLCCVRYDASDYKVLSFSPASLGGLNMQ